jgi:ferric-dicitrate binding protein FerR (iron transport regulator)
MDEHRFYNLMIKSLSETASEEEEKELCEIMKESVENEKLFKKWKALWDKFDKLYEGRAFDKELAQQRILDKIQSRRTQKLRIRYWTSAAASVLILIGLSYLTLFRPDYDKNLLSVANTDKTAQEFVLPDGSHVWLNKHSTISYPEQFSRHSRRVILNGEAYFEVTKDPERVFRVATDHSVTKVLGTSFNLKMTKEDEVSLIVETGRVRFFNKYSLLRRPVLTAGQKAVMDRNGRLEISNQHTDENYLSWKTGILSFDNTPLPEVCRTLSKHYDQRIECVVDDPSLSLTGSFHKEELEDVLSTIGLTFDLHITHEENTIVLHQ